MHMKELNEQTVKVSVFNFYVFVTIRQTWIHLNLSSRLFWTCRILIKILISFNGQNQSFNQIFKFFVSSE